MSCKYYRSLLFLIFDTLQSYQKPVVAIPVSGDQPINANEAQRLGIGISHPYGSMNEEGLYEVQPWQKKIHTLIQSY